MGGVRTVRSLSANVLLESPSQVLQMLKLMLVGQSSMMMLVERRMRQNLLVERLGLEWWSLLVSRRRPFLLAEKRVVLVRKRDLSGRDDLREIASELRRRVLLC